MPRNHKAGHGQCERVLALFREHAGEWIPLTALMNLHITQYNARITELRAMGHRIVNRTEWREGEKHSWYKYEGEHEPAKTNRG